MCILNRNSPKRIATLWIKIRMLIGTLFLVCVLGFLANAVIPKMDTITYWGATLPSQIDKGGNRSIVGGNSGYLTYGPYLSCPAGEYDIKLFYSTDIEGNWVDVFSEDLGARLYKGTLSKDKNVHEISLVLSDNVENLEIRTFYSGIGNLSVERITVYRYNLSTQIARWLINLFIVAVLTGYLGYGVRKRYKEISSKTKMKLWMLLICGTIFSVSTVIYVIAALQGRNKSSNLWETIAGCAVIIGIALEQFSK